MKQGVIAGPYVPNYPEVTDKLALVKSFAARWVYNVLVTKFPIEEDWGDDPVWVFGIVTATKTEIAQKSGVGRSGFSKLWSHLVGAGLVSVRDDGGILIHFYKKKAYDAISATEVRERFTRNEAVIAQLKATIEKDPETSPPEVGDVPPEEADVPPEEADLPPEEASLILLKGLNNNTLSRNKIISWFYRAIGQRRISGSEREKAGQIYKKLRREKFSVREIAFATQWTVENAKAKPRTFGLINNTIGQAMEALQKAEENAKSLAEQQRLVDEARADLESQAEDTKRIDAVKDGMTPRKRKNLREEAFRELTNTPGMREAFIGEPLITGKENEIIKRALEEKQP